ncbi:MAG: hypothetical protein Q4D20_09555 [Clostridia bacterium]|nr:hypothetical protein [Clostridia bacterium]
MGTASSSESGMTGGFRARVDGNKPVVFMAVVNYAKKNLENKDNQFALGRIVVDKTGYADVKTYDEMVAAAKDGDNLLFLAKLFAVAEEVSRNVGADSQVTGIMRFVAKITEFVAKIYRMIYEFFLGFRK